jgi:serine/threonine protein kinase
MAASLPPGTLLSDTYRVVRQIGAGGMGEVYEATHSRLAGRYAVKVLLAEISNRPDIFQRFRREAEVTSGLRHPNIVQVVDFNQTPDGHPYLVMEYLDGIELATEIHRVGAMAIGRVLDIVGQVASALAAAHGHKIIHRDLKPQNMFLLRLPGEEREVVKVMDFGISKVREATTKLTQEATIMGTPQYMAPEQALGRLDSIDERTDEFSLAAITYELLTGRTPFQGEVVPAILYQVVHEQPEPMRQIVPTVSPAVEAVVLKALSKSQNERYPSVLDFHRDLVRAAASQHSMHAVELPEPWPSLPPTSLQPAHEKTTTMGSAVAELEALTSRPATGRRRRIGIGIAGAVALAGVGLAAYWPRDIQGLVGAKPPAPPPAAVAARDTPPPAPKPVLPQPKNATVDVEDSPPGLQATVDGALKELPIVLPYGPEIHSLLFEAPGYESHEIRLDGMREHRSLVLTMKKRAAPGPEAGAEKKPTSRGTATTRARPASRRAEASLSVANTPTQAGAAPPQTPDARMKPTKKDLKMITDF